MQSSAVLIVDDSKTELDAMAMLIAKDGHAVSRASSGEEAVSALLKGRTPIAVAIVDYRMDGKNGAETARELLEIDSRIKVIIYSAVKSREAVRSSWRSGAVDFIDKTTDNLELRGIVNKWVTHYNEEHLVLSEAQSTSNHSRKISSFGMIGSSKGLAQACEAVERYQRTQDPVLIVGERGVGKELFAQGFSLGKKFMALNCASFSNLDLMRSALFGVKKGAFTGAIQNQLGALREVGEGVVFLDEVHHLGLDQQEVLLRVLQEKKVRPVGETREIPINCKIVFGAQPTIFNMAEHGRFHLDLMDRIVCKIEVPTLASRREDIRPLILHFLKEFENETGDRKDFLDKAVSILEAYSWPGNVRELRNEVRRLCLDVDEEVIKPVHLNPKFFAELPQKPKKGPQLDEDLIARLIEKGWSERKIARRLGIPYSTFQRRLKEAGMAKSAKAGS